MVIPRSIMKAGRAAIWPFLAMGLILYFGLNLVEGDHGLRAWVRRAHEVRTARLTLATTHAELARLRHRANILKGSHLDPDLLDEQARASLNMIGPDEVVIFAPTQPPAPTAPSAH
jgi:cell division protein FtsB